VKEEEKKEEGNKKGCFSVSKETDDRLFSLPSFLTSLATHFLCSAPTIQPGKG
jgi:hypothetical protein